MCEVFTKSGLSFMVKMIREIISMPRADSGYPIILWSIPAFSRMTRPNLMPQLTADIECACSWLEVRSWHEVYMHRVRSWHIVSNPTPTHPHASARKRARTQARTHACLQQTHYSMNSFYLNDTILRF